MANSLTPTLVDQHGRLFDTRIESVLIRLSPRLQRQFPSLREELALTEVLEEAGARIVKREMDNGPLENLHGYAWVVMRSIALSRLRRGQSRLADRMMVSRGESVLAAARASSYTASQIEDNVLRKEVLSLLREQERQAIELKEAGYSSAEIAKIQRRSKSAVDAACSRAKSRIRQALKDGGAVSPTRSSPTSKRTKSANG